MRHNLYAFPHKGLRHGLTSFLSNLDTTDAADQPAIDKLKLQATELAFMIKNHSESENEILMTSLAEKMEHSLKTDSDVEEHQQLDHQIAKLSEQLSGLPAKPTDEQFMVIRQKANLLIPELLKHMQSEEIRFLPLFWKYYSDNELNNLHDQVMSSMNPDQLTLWFKYIVPALSPSERTELIEVLKSNAPQDFFNQLMKIAEHELNPVEFNRIRDL